MRLFKWTEAHSIFVPQLDAEHRNIFRLCGDLQKALAQAAPSQELTAILNESLGVVEEHFAHEERMMRSVRYLLIDWHKSQHDTARKRAKAFAARIQAGEADAPREMLAFMGSWLKDHMSVADNMMGAALRNFARAHAA